MKNCVIAFLSFLLLLTSCQDRFDSSDPVDIVSSEIFNLPLVKTISAEDAKQQALTFLYSMKNVTRSAEFDKHVSSVYAWRSKEIYEGETTRSSAMTSLPDTLLYIVNFESEKGYALVSASPKIPGVVAYVEDGSLFPDDDIDNPGFKIFLDGYREYFGQIDTIGNPYQESVVPLFEIEYCDGPLLTTNWGQTSPYNNYCFTSNGEQAVAGCVAIAIGQIAAYHHFPSHLITNGDSLDWNAIMQYEHIPVSDSLACHNVALLVHDIGLLVDMSYGTNSSSAFFSNVEDALSSYGYHFQREYFAEFDSIQADIRRGHPVYMRGTREYIQDGELKYSGHAWVVDGVAVKSMYVDSYGNGESLPELYKITKNLIHCNWGWNGNNNGYFIIGAFENMYYLDDDHITTGYRPYNINNYVYRDIYPLAS